MAMEVRCGQCYGILLIETPGVVVACPHCGVHLSFPGTETETKADPALVHHVDSTVETPYPFKLPTGFTPQEPSVNSVPVTTAPNLSIESNVSASAPLAASQPVVYSNVVPPPMASQPVVTQPVVTQPMPSQPVVTHPVVAHQVVQHQVVQHSVVQQPMVAHPVAPPTALPPSGPDFSWMSSSEPSRTSQVPPSMPFTGLDLGVANVVREAPGFASASISTGEVQRFEPPPSTGYAFSTPATPIPSRPSGHFEHGSTGNLPATPQFDLSTHQSPVETNLSTLNEDVDPSVFVAPSDTRPPTTKSRGSCLGLLLLIVGSYASLVTIYAAYLTLLGRTHQLESLPDLKTVPQQGGRAIVPRPENELPKGHELRIGQSQRYGNVRVTPLRVTRGPISFKYFKDLPGNERAPSDPVLKLWLKFENVSEQQIITPIDSTLMYFQRGHSPVISYNVIFRDVDRKKKDGLFFYNFDRLPPESEWRIVGQDANRELLPHEEYNTFIPSQESVELPSGEVIWRVHFRKGHGPQTGNGVTTLIDVRFDSNDIVPDPT